MSRLVIHQDKIGKPEDFIKLCPFGAMEQKNGIVEITAACRMCRFCEKKGPEGAVTYIADERKSLDKSKWKGIAVYVDHVENEIHPVTYELLGKAYEMAQKIRQPVYALFMGSGIATKSRELLHYCADEVYVYDDPALKYYKIETYTSVFEDFINRVRPAAVLVGATTVGRQLAPRVAARFQTGLTADCTVLDICENTDLVQIRPAFGGNIMARILTPSNRPQLATVRYKVMNAPERMERESGKIISCAIAPGKLTSHVEVLGIMPTEKQKTIDTADVLIVAGRGVRKQEDLSLLYELAGLLGGEVACTRPLVEAGWVAAYRQIGLSGRTVRPKLIITCGVSGAIQFVAGMDKSDLIISIDKDPKANIFKIANYGLVGDLYEVVRTLICRIRDWKEEHCAV